MEADRSGHGDVEGVDSLGHRDSGHMVAQVQCRRREAEVLLTHDQTHPSGPGHRVEVDGIPAGGGPDEGQVPIALQPLQVPFPVSAASEGDRQGMTDRDAK